MAKSAKPQTKPNAKKAAEVATEDPRFAAVLKALAARPKLAGIVRDYRAAKKVGPRKFGSDALKINGKIFAMLSSQGKLVVKLSKARVDELVASNAGVYFDPGHGRLMKQWLSVTSPKIQWIDLVLEAHEFGRSSE